MKNSTVKSVNYHFLRQCNRKCLMCFHKSTSEKMLTIDEAKRGIRLLVEAGCRKLNMSGGEPFLEPDFLGGVVRFAKESLKMESVTIVSNGSLVTEEWMEEFAKYVDILAISCDSFDAETNGKLGRGRKQEQIVFDCHALCQRYNVIFKLNTTITSLNCDENMVDQILALQPRRWKVFQVLILEDNQLNSFLRVSDSQFQDFIARHEKVKDMGIDMVPEPNAIMRDSYLIVDEEFRFLNCQTNEKIPGESILEIGVDKALESAGFDAEAFNARGGEYAYWSKEREIEDLK